MTYRIISIFLGLLLLVAAALKLLGLAVDPVARVGIFSATWFQIAVIEFEIVLGLWLLWGKYPGGAWLATLLTFTAFAGFSFYSGWIGQASCGCFGKVALSPWWAFGIDALVILALLVGRPTLREGNDPIGSALRRDFRPTLATAFLFACAIGATSFGTNHAYGSLDAALARLRGERVSIEPTWVDVGNGAAGEVKDVSFEIRNWTDRTVRVIGGTADCSCRVAGEMPLDVPPGEKRSLTISVRLPASAGIFSRPAHLLVDDGGHLAKIPFDVSGRVQ